MLSKSTMGKRPSEYYNTGLAALLCTDEAI